MYDNDRLMDTSSDQLSDNSHTGFKFRSIPFLGSYRILYNTILSR